MNRYPRHPSRPPRGHGLVWAVVCLSAVGAGAVMLERGFPGGLAPTDAWLFWSCVPLVLLGLGLELSRDALLSARTVAVLAGLAAAAGALAPGGALLLEVGLAALLPTLAWLALVQGLPSRWPNVLAARHGARRIREVRGVQLVFPARRLTAHPGQGFDVVLEAQNCFDRPRRLTLEVGFAEPFRPGREPARVPEALVLELGPGEVARLVAHCVAKTGAVGQHTLRLVPRVEGRGGRRLRRWRAPRYSADVPLVLELLELFTGLTSATRTRLITLAISPGEIPDREWTPRVRTEPLWRPEGPMPQRVETAL